jgi:hypothetical protein
VEFDAVLIEQSVATQYGILPSAQEELPYEEWAKLVNGLMDSTPLGRVIAVRGEKDQKIIAAMTPWQRSIRSEWQAFVTSKATKKPPEELRAQMADLEKMLAKAFGGGGYGRGH